MRPLLCTLVVSLLSVVALAQTSQDRSSDVRVRRLTIESATLPDADRQAIVEQLQGKTYTADTTLTTFSSEMGERVRDSLQTLGYFAASVSDYRTTFVGLERNVRIVDVTVTAEEGLHYYLGEVRFKNGTVFSSQDLRGAIPMQGGELFNVEKMRKGIQNLRNQYVTKGYINFTPVPDTAIDESQHLVSLTFDLDEGERFYFGPLVLDGPEPHIGARVALLESWRSFEGNPYNPEAVQRWFLENRSNVARDPHTQDYVWKSLETSIDHSTHLVTVRLWLP